MARRKIRASVKAKALAACKASLEATGKIEMEKNAKAAGVTVATLRTWWKKENGSATTAAPKSAPKSAPVAAPIAPSKAAKAASKPAVESAKPSGKKRGRPRGRPAGIKSAASAVSTVKATGLEGVDKSIARIEVELSSIRAAFAGYRSALIQKLTAQL